MSRIGCRTYNGVTYAHASPRFINFGSFSVDSITPLIGKRKRRTRPFETTNGTMRVSVGGVRLQKLSKSQTCIRCGVVGTLWLIQQDPPAAPHLNLYADTEAGLVIMTIDHTIPRVKGGTSTLENLTVMCGPCNWRKGLEEDCVGVMPELVRQRHVRRSEIRWMPLYRPSSQNDIIPTNSRGRRASIRMERQRLVEEHLRAKDSET